jgi:tetratricopeptide (TPR) repeat protein
LLKRFKNFPGYLILLVTGYLLLSGCSTTKNRFINRVYHSLLARDNGYFNARILVEEAEQKLSLSQEDKFDRILPIFKYGDDVQAKAIYPQMDEAIKKVSLVIQRQSMLIRGTEYNSWIDDNYLLMAKAQFLKHDFYTSTETFQYVAIQYKKEPIHYEALLWLIETYLQLKDYGEAETRIDYIKNDKKFPTYLKGRLYITMADFFLKKENFPKATEFLKKAIPLTKKRQQKTRYLYILAQLYQKKGKNQEATKNYLEVIKRNPPYEMAFNAQINIARSTEAASKNSKNVKKSLNKMLKDDKNIEYFDQIYYALASISLKENDVPSAISYLKQSIKANKKNVNQKALSYLELANIYFVKPDYEPAQMYYDSTMNFLTKDYPDYEMLLNKRNTLTLLVKNIRLIAYEDSMQRLAALSPAERNKALDKIIAKVKADAERKKAELEAAKTQSALMPSTSASSAAANIPAGGGQTAWYFYNPSTISFGLSEFVKRWGDRKLEDNWRRKNKEVVILNADGQKDTSAQGKGQKKDSANASSSSEKIKYLNDIPTTDKALAQSNDRVMEAYNNLGTIYKEQFHDNEAAIKALENLVKRFPKGKYTLPAYYNLYRLYLQLNNTEKTAYYKNIIVSQYPESEYTKILTNPNYLKDSKKRLNLLETFYEETYKLYLEKNYPEVMLRKSKADSLFPGNVLTPKFNYLKAMSAGSLGNLDEFEKELSNLILEFPKDPVSEQATDILKNIKIKRSGEVVAQSGFSAKTDTSQFYVVTFLNKALDINKLKAKLSDFNVKYFRTISISTTDMLLDSTTQLVLVKTFPTKKQSLDYFNSFKTITEVFDDFKTIEKQQFLITPENFTLFYKEKNIPKYLKFFEQNYLQ